MKAVIAGTFDPFTTGHKNIVERALGIFGDVTIAVASDTGKNTASLDIRTEIARLSVLDLQNVSVEPFSGLLSDFLTAQGECVLVRGIRNVRDAEYERDLSRVYCSLCDKDTVVLFTDARFEHVSSSVVRELVALDAELDGYVVPAAEELIKKTYVKRS